MIYRPTDQEAALAAWRKPKSKRAGKVTGPGGLSSSPIASAEHRRVREARRNVGTILRASDGVRTEWARRWRAGESVFLIHYHHAGRTRLLCCDVAQALRVFARAVRATAHRINVYTEPDTEG